MDTTILAAVIGAVSTVVAAILGQTGVLDALLRGRRYPKLPTEWNSTWIDIKDKERKEYRERFFITRQRGAKIRGYILVDAAPDKRWEFEGNFTGRFLQLFYYPSEKADDKFFQDYGCYFFELRGTDFIGYSVGYDYIGRELDLSEHKLVAKA
ncbi:MAG: hypothetical protein WCQ52_08250 [Actinomycetes bacterium]